MIRLFDSRSLTPELAIFLRHMRAFYQAFPIWNAVRTELSWTHYRTLLKVEDPRARKWYMEEATR